MYQKVKKYIGDQQMLNEKDRVIIGVSGGADSVCLLFVLLELKKELGFEIKAVHINHGIRGASAVGDEEYVKRICEENDVALFVFHEDVKEHAKIRGLSLEEAGRKVRRECFLKVFREQGGTRIALAHHQDDNAETVLWNLCRGSGLKGAGGISPKNGVWIRPFLCLNRREIELYLENRGISYCTDETNLEDDYTRNKLRHHVLPYLEKHINDRAVEHINQCASQLQLVGQYIEDETKRYILQSSTKGSKGEILLREEDFRKIPDALKSGVIYQIICDAAGKKKDIESIHVEKVWEFLNHQVGRKIDLPYQIEVIRCYEGLRFQKKEKDGKMGSPEKAENICQMRVFERCTEIETFPQNPYTKWFDYDIIRNTVKIRHREPGDYIVIDKSGKTQKIKQYFINAKIPKEMRDDIWLAADGRQILWIVGYRQSQAYQVTESTKKILEIEFYGGKRDGREHKSNDPGRRSHEEN